MSLKDTVFDCRAGLGQLIAYWWRIRLVRFGGGGCLNLSTKLLLTFVLRTVGLGLWLNYALVHSVTVVISYLYHSRITFKKEMSLGGFKKFFGSVLVLKFLDYLVVVVTNSIGEVESCLYQIPRYGRILGDNLLYLVIITSTTTIFFIRYFLYKKIF